MSIRSQHEQEQKSSADGRETLSENVAWHTLAVSRGRGETPERSRTRIDGGRGFPKARSNSGRTASQSSAVARRWRSSAPSSRT